MPSRSRPTRPGAGEAVRAPRARRGQPAGLPRLPAAAPPVKGENRYFVVTQWESDEAFQAWANGPPAVEAHAGQQKNPVATGASLLEFEVVLDVAGTGTAS